MQNTLGNLHQQPHETIEGYPEILIRAGTEILATIHDLGKGRRDEMKARAALFCEAPGLLAERNSFWDLLSDMVEDPHLALPEGLRAKIIAQIETSQNQDAIRGWIDNNNNSREEKG